MQRTRIADLPELADDFGDDMLGVGDGGLQVPGDLPRENYSKFIRNNHSMAPGSGMSRNSHETYGGYNPSNSRGGHATMNYEENYQEQQPPMPMMPPPPPAPASFSCLDIAGHVQNCPICSKLYANDKTVYIIAIVILILICLLLMKRVLNV